MSKYWKMKDGVDIMIRDMSNMHLINSIKMLNRRYVHLKTTSTDFDGIKPGEMFDSYTELAIELRKRGLRVPAPNFAGIDSSRQRRLVGSLDNCDQCGGKKRGYTDDYFINKCYCEEIRQNNMTYEDEEEERYGGY